MTKPKYDIGQTVYIAVPYETYIDTKKKCPCCNGKVFMQNLNDKVPCSYSFQEGGNVYDCVDGILCKNTTKMRAIPVVVGNIVEDKVYMLHHRVTPRNTHIYSRVHEDTIFSSESECWNNIRLNEV